MIAEPSMVVAETKAGIDALERREFLEKVHANASLQS